MLFHERLKKIKYVAFDMDGLLIDSERLMWECYDHACHQFGVNISFDIYQNTIGTDWKETERVFREQVSDIFPYKQIECLAKAVFQDSIKVINKSSFVKPGALELLKYCKAKGMKTMVVSSTDSGKIKQYLERFELLGFLDGAVSCDQVESPKPAPDVYLYTMKKFGCMHCEQLLILEDSNNGVIAGLNAGATVIQIPDICLPSRDFQNNSKYAILPSLKAVISVLEEASVHV